MKNYIFLIMMSTFLTDPPNLDVGKKIYKERCKVCHGENGNVNPFAASVLSPPPRNFTLEKSKQELSFARMIHSVTEGRAGTAMMPWKNILTSVEIHSVVNYIRKNLMKLKSNLRTNRNLN
jgi:mono/diheme cytochrome c family protein